MYAHERAVGCKRRDRQLRGRIEMDETFIGGSEKGGKCGRGAERNDIVVIAVEVRELRGGRRVRMRSVQDASGASLTLIPFVCDPHRNPAR